MTKKDYKLELLAAIENNRDKDALQAQLNEQHAPTKAAGVPWAG
jgi:hypothetical protein